MQVDNHNICILLTLHSFLTHSTCIFKSDPVRSLFLSLKHQKKNFLQGVHNFVNELPFATDIYITMAYNNRNYKKHVQNVLAVYDLYKHSGIPDTTIVRLKFPQHGLNMSYRKWMNIKGLKPSEYN